VARYPVGDGLKNLFTNAHAFFVSGFKHDMLIFFFITLLPVLNAIDNKIAGFKRAPKECRDAPVSIEA
jgi:hypothetical protein